MIKYEDIWFKTRRTKKTETKNTMIQDNGEIGKKLDKKKPEDLLEYI